jgi:hypothetical protein
MSAPLANQIEVTGIPRTRIFVSSSNAKFQSHLKLYDVSADGTQWKLMSRGNYAIRSNTSSNPRQLDIELRALSHIVPAGNRIGIEMTSLDMFNTDAANIVPFFASTNASLVSSSALPSYVDIQIVGSGPTEAVEASSLPNDFVLYQNYPNPFNPTTTVRFEVRGSGLVRLSVFDVLGREVASLVNGELAAGEYSIPFPADGLASGEYFYRLTVGEKSSVRKMVVVR